MEIKVTYEAKSVEEVLQLVGAGVGIKPVDIKQPELVSTELPEEETKPEDSKEEVKEDVKEETAETFTKEDLTQLAVQANKAGKLSQVKELLEEHDIAKISKVPDELVDTIGQALTDLVG